MFPGEPDFDAPGGNVRPAAVTRPAAPSPGRAGCEGRPWVISSFDWFALDGRDRRPGAILPGPAGPRVQACCCCPVSPCRRGVATALESGYDEVHAPVDEVLAAPEALRRAQEKRSGDRGVDGDHD